MKLNYRGVSYEYNPPAVEFGKGDANQQQGLDWRFRNPKKALTLDSNLDLKYRGVAHRTNSDTGTLAVAPATNEASQVSGSSTQDKARFLMMHHQRVIKNRQQTILSRSAAEAGLVSNISTYWNRIQGKIHPTFRVDYDRSSATLS